MTAADGLPRCWICTEGASRTRRGRLWRSCACRGPDAGFAHLHCLVEAAGYNADTWTTCPTCKQDFTGDLQLRLAQASWRMWVARDADDGRRLDSADRLAQALQCAGTNPGYWAALPLMEYWR